MPDKEKSLLGKYYDLLKAILGYKPDINNKLGYGAAKAGYFVVQVLTVILAPVGFIFVAGAQAFSWGSEFCKKHKLANLAIAEAKLVGGVVGVVAALVKLGLVAAFFAAVTLPVAGIIIGVLSLLVIGIATWLGKKALEEAEIEEHEKQQVAQVSEDVHETTKGLEEALANAAERNADLTKQIEDADLKLANVMDARESLLNPEDSSGIKFTKQALVAQGWTNEEINQLVEHLVVAETEIRDNKNEAISFNEALQDDEVANGVYKEQLQMQLQENHRHRRNSSDSVLSAINDISENSELALDQVLRMEAEIFVGGLDEDESSIPTFSEAVQETEAVAQSNATSKFKPVKAVLASLAGSLSLLAGASVPFVKLGFLAALGTALATNPVGWAILIAVVGAAIIGAVSYAAYSAAWNATKKQELRTRSDSSAGHIADNVELLHDLNSEYKQQKTNALELAVLSGKVAHAQSDIAQLRDIQQQKNGILAQAMLGTIEHGSKENYLAHLAQQQVVAIRERVHPDVVVEQQQPVQMPAEPPPAPVHSPVQLQAQEPLAQQLGSNKQPSFIDGGHEFDGYDASSIIANDDGQPLPQLVGVSASDNSAICLETVLRERAQSEPTIASNPEPQINKLRSSSMSSK